MHEASLMEEALRIAEDSATRHGCSAVRRLVLRVGKLSGVEPVALRFAFEALSPGTCAEGGVLELHEVAARCLCATCQEEFEPADWIFACPRCGRIAGQVVQGGELEVETIEAS